MGRAKSKDRRGEFSDRNRERRYRWWVQKRRIGHMTRRHHRAWACGSPTFAGAGVVIFAPTRAHAREVAAAYFRCVQDTAEAANLKEEDVTAVRATRFDKLLSYHPETGWPQQAYDIDVMECPIYERDHG